jgi:hypothetical protein
MTITKTIQAIANINKPSVPLGIFRRLFDTKINIIRKTTSKDATGDLDETFLTNQYNIPANIQPLTGEDLNINQGTVNYYTHRVFLPKALRQQDKLIVYISIQEGDKIYDQESEITYRVRQVEDYILPNKYKSRTKLHHFEILVERINDARYTT